MENEIDESCFIKVMVDDEAQLYHVNKMLRGIINTNSIRARLRVPNDIIMVYIDPKHISRMINLILDQYETMGMNVSDVDIYGITVYTSAPELNAYFTQKRMNLQMCANDALVELINDIAFDAASTQMLVNRIDAVHTMNGTYQFKKFMQLIANSFERSGVPIAESMNALITPQVH